MSLFHKHLTPALFNTAFLLLLTQALFSQNTFIKTDTIFCGDSITYIGLGYPSWIIPEILIKPHNGYATIITDGVYSKMQYKAPSCFKGADTIVVLCAKATQISCDTGIYILNIDCKEVANQTNIYNIKCADSATTYLSGFGVAQITEGPYYGTFTMYRDLTDLDSLVYKPDSTFSGMDYIKLDLFNGLIKWLLIYHVDCKIISDSREIEEANTIIYPNPITGDKLRIFNSTQSIKNVYLINSLGIPLSNTFSSTQGEIIVDVSKLPNGWYTIIFEEQSKRKFKRFLILH